MQKILTLFLVVAVFVVTACAHKQPKPKKSSTHIYEGDAPSIKFMDQPEAAGGPVHTY
jgi:uncharacterized GH25 family protein